MKRLTLSIIAIVTLSISLAGTVEASFADKEISVRNSFSSGGLDFTLTQQEYDPREGSISFATSTPITKRIDLSMASSSVDVTYFASTTGFSGDQEFCDEIFVSAYLDGNLLGSDSLVSFKSSTTTNISTTTADMWTFDLSSNPFHPTANSICNFGFTYDGRQAKHYSLTGGFIHAETATSTIYSWGLRINQIYEGGVQIYNQTDTDVDLSGWQICDGEGCNVISTSTSIIQAKGYSHVLTGDSSSKLILKRPDGETMDEVEGVSVVAGEIEGRKPDGHDTNQVSDFVHLLPPVLTLLNPNQSGTQIWYWTNNYNITWTAFNQNGPDSDLMIDLSFIKDVDGSGTISPGDENVVIKKDLTNTGTYNWTVPSGFIGYTWIDIVAFDHGNHLLNSEVVSGKVYDPAIQ